MDPPAGETMQTGAKYLSQINRGNYAYGVDPNDPNKLEYYNEGYYYNIPINDVAEWQYKSLHLSNTSSRNFTTIVASNSTDLATYFVNHLAQQWVDEYNAITYYKDNIFPNQIIPDTVSKIYIFHNVTDSSYSTYYFDLSDTTTISSSSGNWSEFYNCTSYNTDYFIYLKIPNI